MTTRTVLAREKTPSTLTEILYNTGLIYWFVCYYIARVIRIFFHLSKPKLTFSDYVNDPNSHLVDVITQ